MRLLVNMLREHYMLKLQRGKTSASCKNDFLKKFGITARQFNACRVSLEGKISACKAGQEQAIASLKQQIDSLDKKSRILKRNLRNILLVHQKKRRKANLSCRLASLEEDQKDKGVSLCFGGKKLFHAQFHLEKNGFASHEEWKRLES